MPNVLLVSGRIKFNLKNDQNIVCTNGVLGFWGFKAINPKFDPMTDKIRQPFEV